jgi:hypothetical protein
MDFSEAIIIPIKLFSQCSFEKGGQQVSILDNPNLDPDLKMKLYNQQKHFEKVRHLENEKDMHQNFTQFLEEFPIIKRPLVKNIFEIIRDHPKLISWNDKLEVSINGKFYPLSNIVKLMRYILGEIVITSDIDKPQGADQFVSVLMDVGIPKEWINVYVIRKSTRKPSVLPMLQVHQDTEPQVRIKRTAKRLLVDPYSPPLTRFRKKKQRVTSPQIGSGWFVL